MSLKNLAYFVSTAITFYLLFMCCDKEFRTFCHIDDIEMTIWDNKLIFGHYMSLLPPKKNFLEVDLFPDNEFSRFYVSISNDSVLRIFSNTPFLSYDLSNLDFREIELIIDESEDVLHQWCLKYDLYENRYSDDIRMSVESSIGHHSMVQDYRVKANESTIHNYIYVRRFLMWGHSCWKNTFYLDSEKLIK